jgi:quercetin dioxygenase-like cupin family protein
MKAHQGQTVSVVGDRYTFLVVGEQSGGAFAMFEFVVPPDHGPPPHIHRREDEVFHVLEGTFEFTVAGQRHRLGPGDTLYGERGIAHTFKNVGEGVGRMIAVVAPAGLENFFAEVGTPLPRRDALPIEATSDDIARLLAAAPRYGLEILRPG